MGFDEIFFHLNTFVLLFAKYTIKFKQLVCTLRDRLIPLVWHHQMNFVSKQLYFIEEVMHTHIRRAFQF